MLRGLIITIMKTKVRTRYNFIYGMELVNLIQERLLVALKDFTLNMLMIQAIGEERFILLSMLLIRVELMAPEVTVII
jgi:hypothetical protein